jgi:hypothetical protein
LTARGESLVLKVHDFIRAVNATKQKRALAPDGCFFGALDFHHRLLGMRDREPASRYKLIAVGLRLTPNP